MFSSIFSSSAREKRKLQREAIRAFCLYVESEKYSNNLLYINKYKTNYEKAKNALKKFELKKELN